MNARAEIEREPAVRPASGAPSAEPDEAGRDASGSPASDKRVLLFSYELGASGHTGGFRWHHLIEHLVGLGWEFDVIVSDRAFAIVHGHDYGPRVRLHPVSGDWVGARARRVADPWIVRGRHALKGVVRPLRAIEVLDGPVELAVWRHGDRRPAAGRVLEAARGAWSSAEDLVWVRRAVVAARPLVASRRPDVVVATTPEWLVQLAGAAMAREFRLPYAADLRDVWFFGRGDDAGFIDGARRRLWRHHEIRTTRLASLVIDNTPVAHRVVGDAIRPFADTPRVAIPNSMPRIEGVREPDPARFLVAFVGWLYPFMDPRPLLTACARLARRHRLGPEELQIGFTGTGEHFYGTSLDALARSCGVGEHFSARGRVPVAVAQRIMRDAAVLVVMDFPHGLQTPSKFYHYAQMHGSLLPIGYAHGSLAEAAARLGVATVPPDDGRGLDAALDAALRRWRARDYATSNDPEGIFLTSRTAALMDRALGSLATPRESAPSVEPGRDRVS